MLKKGTIIIILRIKIIIVSYFLYWKIFHNIQSAKIWDLISCLNQISNIRYQLYEGRFLMENSELKIECSKHLARKSDEKSPISRYQHIVSKYWVHYSKHHQICYTLYKCIMPYGVFIILYARYIILIRA